MHLVDSVLEGRSYNKILSADVNQYVDIFYFIW